MNCKRGAKWFQFPEGASVLWKHEIHTWSGHGLRGQRAAATPASPVAHLPETGRMMSTGSTSSFTLMSGTGGPRTEESAPPTAVVGGGAAATEVMGGVMGTAPGMVAREAAGCDGGLAAVIMVGGTATVG